MLQAAATTTRGAVVAGPTTRGTPPPLPAVGAPFVGGGTGAGPNLVAAVTIGAATMGGMAPFTVASDEDYDISRRAETFVGIRFTDGGRFRITDYSGQISYSYAETAGTPAMLVSFRSTLTQDNAYWNGRMTGRFDLMTARFPGVNLVRWAAGDLGRQTRASMGGNVNMVELFSGWTMTTRSVVVTTPTTTSHIERFNFKRNLRYLSQGKPRGL